MCVEILGCSGGIGGNGMCIIFLFIDDDILIDVGIGVGDLLLMWLVQIDYVFIIYVYLDYIVCLLLMIDSVGDMCSMLLIMYVMVVIMEIICKYIFNWYIWFDFSVILIFE